MNRTALALLAPAPGERLLEIGFGGGALLRAMRARGAAVAGVDVSEAMVRRQSGFDVHVASAERLPFGDAAFDKAVSLNSLYFWPELPEALGELARVVVPGGILLLGFEPPEELRRWPGHRHGFRLYEAEELVRLAAAAGFGNHRMTEGRGRKPDRFLFLSLERLPDREPR